MNAKNFIPAFENLMGKYIFSKKSSSLFEVSKNGKNAYVFGVCHNIPNEYYGNDILNVIENQSTLIREGSSKTIYKENYYQSDYDIIYDIFEAGKDKFSNEKLFKKSKYTISPAHFLCHDEKLCQVMRYVLLSDKYKETYNSINEFNSRLISNVLYGYICHDGIDNYLTHFYTKNNKKVCSLDENILFLDDYASKYIAKKLGYKLFFYSLINKKKIRDLKNAVLNESKNSYLYKSLDETIERTKKTFHKRDPLIIDTRNILWRKTLIDAFEYKDPLYLVGLDHLFGTNGIMNTFRNYNFTIKNYHMSQKKFIEDNKLINDVIKM